MAAAINSNEWELFESLSETYALPESCDFKDAEAFNRLLRSRIPPRGQRFNHDHRDTCAYIARSKNLNVVAYTANFVVPLSAAPAGAGSSQPPPQAEQQQQQQTAPAAALPHHHHHVTAPQRMQPLPPGTAFVSSGQNVDCVFNVLNPVHAYFVNLEPSYVEARRKKGIVGDCDDLKMLERRFAYGYNAKLFDCEKHIMEQLPAHLKPDGRLYAALAVAAACGGNEADARAGQQEILGRLRDWWAPLQPMMGNFVALPVWPAIMMRLKPLTPAKPAEEDDQAPQQSESSWCSDADTVPVIVAVIDKRLSVLEKVYVKSIERWLRLPTVEYIEVFGVSLEDGQPTYEKLSNNGQYQPPTDLSKEEMAEAMSN